MSYWGKREQLDKLQAIFKSVLGNATPDDIFIHGELTVSVDKKRLREFSSSKLLSHAIYEVDFPRVAGPVDLYHYTTIDGFRGIIREGKIYLYPVAKRMKEGEFHPYAFDNEFDGYYTPDPETCRTYGQELSEDLYYISLTDLKNGDDEDQFWSYFSEHRGVRLKLRLTPKVACDLRRMKYRPKDGKTALTEINELLGEKLGLRFCPHESSRIPAFYLPDGFKAEDETRLMIKKHIEGKDRTIQFGDGMVWPVPLAAPGGVTNDDWCEIELLEVKVAPNGNGADVQSELDGTIYQSVPVT
ncbi:hypothetical protein [Paenochrobactrum glaciei]|uniref:Uncharacterized protein n=1 Tax=Paenochrobactrum glaciei TaxID=486407 RepID=A0ABP3RU80_9HYPH